MCGFFGIWSRDGSAVDLGALQNATRTLAHRGPDDEGYLLVNTQTSRIIQCTGPDTCADVPGLPLSAVHGQEFDFALGFRRLSILDLSAAGHQPMGSPDGNHWIVFNGEVYNYLELRDELRRDGISFETGTDTEVVLAAYRRWGAECLQRFNGMWAFAIWDNRQQNLFLARDRFGIKPLFYSHTKAHRIAFASEIKALLSCGEVAFRACKSAVAAYVTFASMPSHRDGATFYEQIRAVPPSTRFSIGREQESLTRYWSIPRADRCEADPAELCDEYLEFFTDAVRIQLRADVPIGTCLSGGIDSSSIVVAINQLMQREFGVTSVQLGKRQKTFSAVYDGTDCWNERQFVDSVVRSTIVEPHYVVPTGARLWTDIEKLVWHQEEPFHSLSIYAGWNVMRLAAEANIKVLLNGQGADEYLAGYRPFGVYLRELLRTGRVLAMLREARRIGDINSTNLADLAGAVLLPYLARPIAACRGAVAAFTRRKEPSVGRWLKREIALSGLLPEHKAEAARFADHEWRRKQSNLSDHLSLELSETSLPLLLRYEDRNAMAFSIEARVPFLDHRLVEFIFQRASSLRIHQGWTKWIHRKAFDKLLPRDVCWRSDKVGFDIPEGKWLRENKLMLMELFDGNSPVGYYLDKSVVRREVNALDAHGDARSDQSGRTWRWVNLAQWLRTMSAGTLRAAPAA